MKAARKPTQLHRLLRWIDRGKGTPWGGEFLSGILFPLE